jgi:predicted DNA-binding transcriptional regulator AlpA
VPIALQNQLQQYLIYLIYMLYILQMHKFSTRQVAKRLGITAVSLGRYIKTGKITAPPETMVGGIKLRLWSESEIELLQEELPKIANGRKTRYSKLRKKQKAQPGAAVTQKGRRRPGKKQSRPPAKG